ncbi:uncharacterized protein LOC135397403 [Ornithodoros turicata]|uniref:uncharacterized protein LOC135397403 n=1 Tax=Ornithodoros turicata TaxID=34597 RepID=UPI003139DB3F
MGGKKKQKTKWRKLSIGPEEHPGCASANQRENDQNDTGGAKSPRITSWVAVPLVPLIPPPPPQCYTENGPDNHNGETKGCYVNGLWIPNSELGRYRSSAPPPPPVGPSLPPPPSSSSSYYLYFIFPNSDWPQPEVTQAEGETPSLCRAVTYPLVLAPHPQLISRSRYYRGRRKPKSFADFGTANGEECEPSNISSTVCTMDDFASKTFASSMEEAKPEIVSTLHQLSCLAARLLDSILKDVETELRKVLRLEDAVDGRANKLASQIVSDAVSASAKSLLEITRREERAGKKNLMTTIRDKAHFLGVTATFPEPVLRGMLGTGDDQSEPSLIHPHSKRLSSEDIQVLGHIYVKELLHSKGNQGEWHVAPACLQKVA